MTNLAVAIVGIWVRLYTMGFEATVRERIRQEIEADLWEQMNSGSTSGSPMKNAMTIFLRLILGMPADVQRMIEEPSFGGFSVNTMKVWGVVTRRQFWINFLVVSGVFLSFIILVIAPLVVAIINRL